METIFLVITVGLLIILSFCIGVKIGQAVVKGEPVEMPTLNPIKLYEEHQDKKEAEKELNKLDVIMQNIEKYDGTERGQEDVPR